MVHQIKDALERDLSLLHPEDKSSSLPSLHKKVEKLGRIFHLTKKDKAELHEYVEGMLAGKPDHPSD